MESRLKSLCLSAGLPCEEDVSDLVCFQVDEKLTLMLVVDGKTDRLSVECDVAVVLPEDRPEAYRLIATANFRFLLTDDSTLGIDPVSGTVCLSRRVPIGSLDETSFPVLITRFLDTAERWQEHLGRLSSQLPGTSDSSPNLKNGGLGDFLNARA